MIHLDADILLVVGILGFYLVDSARLLHVDEVAVASAGRGWRVGVDARIELRGRFLLLPDPLTPFRTVLQASWLHPGAGEDDPASLERFRRPLWPVRAGCAVVAALVLLAIPALLLTSRDPRLLLLALAAAWLVIAAMLVATWRQRARLGLGRRRFAALAVESLLCPPCAANLYRRLCALRGFRGDPVAFAARHAPAEARQRLLAAIEARIDMFAMADEDDGGQPARMRAARARIRRALA